MYFLFEGNGRCLLVFVCCKVLAYDLSNAIAVEEETAMMAVPTEKQSKTFLRLTGARSKRAVIFARRKRCVNGN